MTESLLKKVLNRVVIVFLTMPFLIPFLAYLRPPAVHIYKDIVVDIRLQGRMVPDSLVSNTIHGDIM